MDSFNFTVGTRDDMHLTLFTNSVKTTTKLIKITLKLFDRFGIQTTRHTQRPGRQIRDRQRGELAQALPNDVQSVKRLGCLRQTEKVSPLLVDSLGFVPCNPGIGWKTGG